MDQVSGSAADCERHVAPVKWAVLVDDTVFPMPQRIVPADVIKTQAGKTWRKCDPDWQNSTRRLADKVNSRLILRPREVPAEFRERLAAEAPWLIGFDLKKNGMVLAGGAGLGRGAAGGGSRVPPPGDGSEEHLDTVR